MTDHTASPAAIEILVLSDNVVEAEDLMDLFRAKAPGKLLAARTWDEAADAIDRGMRPRVAFVGADAGTQRVKSLIDALRAGGCRLILVDQSACHWQLGDAILNRPYTNEDVSNALSQIGAAP